MFIDRTNRTTTMLKRVTEVSCCMYDLENMRTFEAINKTVKDVIRPTGSRIIGKVSSELLIVVISQCRSTVF